MFTFSFPKLQSIMSFYKYLPNDPEKRAKQMGLPLFMHQYAKSAREYLKAEGYDPTGKTDADVWEAALELHEEQAGQKDEFIGAVAGLTDTILAMTPGGRKAAREKAKLEQARAEAERERTKQKQQMFKIAALLAGLAFSGIVIFKVFKQ